MFVVIGGKVLYVLFYPQICSVRSEFVAILKWYNYKLFKDRQMIKYHFQKKLIS